MIYKDTVMDLNIESNVSSLDGAVVSMETMDTVKDVLDRVCKENGITLGIIELIYDGKTLEGDTLMSKTGIGRSDVITVNANDEAMARLELERMDIAVTSEKFLEIVGRKEVGDVEIMRLFCKIKSMINCKDDDGESVLMLASRMGHAEIVEILERHTN